jgi:CheY-like chemotaxis protein
VDSEPGSGTTFRVYLPRIEATAAAPAPSEPRQALAACGGETLLLVEDEEPLREVVRSLLTRHGYDVLVAASGVAAIDVAAAHPGPIDLLVSDLVMPGIQGRELAREIRRSRPRVKVLYMSGYAPDGATQGDESEPATAFLAKPFPGATLLRQCRELLAMQEPPELR